CAPPCLEPAGRAGLQPKAQLSIVTLACVTGSRRRADHGVRWSCAERGPPSDQLVLAPRGRGRSRSMASGRPRFGAVVTLHSARARASALALRVGFTTIASVSPTLSPAASR